MEDYVEVFNYDWERENDLTDLMDRNKIACDKKSCHTEDGECEHFNKCNPCR